MMTEGLIYCSTKPFFGWPQGPKKTYSSCFHHAKKGMNNLISINILLITLNIGMVNLNRLDFNSQSGPALSAFKQLCKSMSIYVVEDLGKQDCVFQSVLKPILLRKSDDCKNIYSVGDLRKTLKCPIRSPFPYSKLMQLAQEINFNILLILVDNGETSVSPFRSFIIQVSFFYIILVWNNLTSHTEPMYDEYGSFFWSREQLERLQCENLFDLDKTSTNSNGGCILSNIPRDVPSNGVIRRVKMQESIINATIFMGKYVSKEERELENPNKIFKAGMFPLQFLSELGSLEMDYVSEDDDTVDWICDSWDDGSMVQKILLPSIIHATPGCVTTREEYIIEPKSDNEQGLVIQHALVDDTIVNNEKQLTQRLTLLSKKQEKAVLNAFKQPNEKVLITKFNIPITGEHIKRLGPTTWLNDEIVNFYMQLLQAWDQQLCEADKTRRPSYFFNTAFMPLLLKENNEIAFEKVSR